MQPAPLNVTGEEGGWQGQGFDSESHKNWGSREIKGSRQQKRVASFHTLATPDLL
jgi:hypothetical protein